MVGSGAGGGPLAANLARAGRKVLLIEAGAAPNGLLYDVPAFHGLSTEDPAIQWNYFVRHWANPPAPDSKNQTAAGGIWYPRAGTLGGCTAHNAMITIYPDDADWDAVAAATGDSSWSASQMRRYFQRLERCTYRPRWKDALYNWSGHGYDGWLPTSIADPLLVLRDEKLIGITRACAEAVGIEGVVDQILSELPDPNDERTLASPGGRHGLFLPPLAVGKGHRYGARDYVQDVAHSLPDRLTILSQTLVTRVLFHGRRAVGVEYLPQAHAYSADPSHETWPAPWNTLQAALREVRTNREVILSAGAFNSPQLLMLSGVGPRDELAEHRIPLIADRPGIGSNLQDRYEIGVVSQFDTPFRLLRDCGLVPPPNGSTGDPCFAEWLDRSGGPYATNGVLVAIFHKSRPERPRADLCIFGIPGSFLGYYPGYSRDAIRPDHFTWAILKAHTNNTAGRVRLRSADPRDTPDVLFRYFEEGNDASGEDLDSMVAGVEFVRRINARLREFRATEQVPGPNVRTSAEIADYVRREAWGHHASCSNKMGPASDPMAVVDSQFRVHGTEGLRVVDASVFPRIPGFFIVTSVYMIAEKATDAILGV